MLNAKGRRCDVCARSPLLFFIFILSDVLARFKVIVMNYFGYQVELYKHIRKKQIFLDKDHVSSLKDSFTKYTSKATTIGRAQGLMQKHFETLRPLLFYPKNTLPAASDHAGCCHGYR